MVAQHTMYSLFAPRQSCMARVGRRVTFDINSVEAEVSIRGCLNLAAVATHLGKAKTHSVTLGFNSPDMQHLGEQDRSAIKVRHC